MSKNLRPRHWMHGTPSYSSWVGMRSRCLNPKAVAYANYGGRGIRICDRWNSFQAFYDDMGPRPDGHWLERINNDGNYEPSNCKWATVAEQSLNKRNVISIEYRGVTLPLFQWAKRLGLSPRKVHWRYKRGLTTEQVLSTAKGNRWKGVPPCP